MNKIKIVIVLSLSVILFNIQNVYAENFKFENQYEVEIIEKILSEIDAVKPDNTSLYIINFNYDFYNRKDKMYSNYIIKSLVSKLCKTVPFYTINMPEITEYIKENESNEVYDDQNIWKKIKTWILLRPGLMELERKNSIKEQEEEYEKYLKRRNELLEKIIQHRSEYSMILRYLSLLDGPQLDYEERPDDFIKSEEALKKLIADYPNSEFAYYASQQLASFNDVKGNPQKAIKELENLINNTKNFYSGAGDFHSSIAGKLLTLYREAGNKEKVKYYMAKINPIVKNFNEIMAVCNKYLNGEE